MNIVKVNKWLKSNGFETKVIKGIEYNYNYVDNVISVYNDTSEFSEFKEFITKFGYSHNFSLNTLSFLHELGHEETLDDVSDLTYAFDCVVRYIVEKFDVLHYFYYSLPLEIMATQWALTFINENYDLVEELDQYMR